MFVIYSIITFLLSYNLANCEVYTALADLEELLQTEAVLIDALESYIQAQEQKLNLLRRFADAYQNQHDIASQDVQMYVANPINAYLLVKRLTTDWKQVESLMNKNIGDEFSTNISAHREYLKFPSDEDLNGAAVALTRLQDTYHLDTSSLARGELNGVKYSTELSAADCFELGRQSYNNEDYYHTQLWMREADSRLGKEANETVDRSEILEYLAFSTYKQGNVHLALDLTNKLLEIIPAHPRALGNKAYYEDAIKSTNLVKRKGDDEDYEEEDGRDKRVSNFAFDESRILEQIFMLKWLPGQELDNYEVYQKLCRSEITIPHEIGAQLKCYYHRNEKNLFLLIAPFKVEEAYLSPRILIFHNVMLDKEISVVKKLAQPRFKRATVQNAVTGELETAQYRISKSAWLKESEHKYIDDISRRVEHMTGLTMQTAEELQVVNYGIGGHYEPHFDFARKEETNAFKSLGTGNRIATVLFYMSDVQQGGATVFPNINVALWPRKGSAAFWYNLHPSGDGDLMTRHAACPVLAGSKWVSNKWIHEVGQEFRRPCDLEEAPPELTA